MSVLDKKLYNDAHIANSINIELGDLKNFLKDIDKDSHLVFYCTNTMCTSSDEAAKISISMGYENVYVYKGGIADWYQKSKKDKKFIVDGLAKMKYLEMFFVHDSDNTISSKTKNRNSYKIIDANNLQKMIENNRL